MNEGNKNFIKELSGIRGYSQADIARKIAEKRSREQGKPLSPNEYKGIVNKWFNGSREPGKEYLLDLSEILNVSVESILRGKIVASSLETRPTAYLAALSGEESIIDCLFGSLESYDIRVTTSDEYGKSFIDYVLEFGNYSALKTAIDKGFCKIGNNGINNDLVLNNKDKEIELLRLIVKADGIDVFSQLYKRLSPIKQLSNSYAGSILFYYPIPYELCDDILQSDKILDFFSKSSPLTEDEIQLLYMGLCRTEETIIDHMPSLTPAFNVLLNRALELKVDKKTNALLQVASDYIDSIAGDCKPFYKQLRIDNDGGLGFINEREVVAFVPVVNSMHDCDNPNFKKIVKFNKKFTHT